MAKSWDNKTYVFCLSSLILTSEQCQSLSMLSRAHKGCYPSPPIHFLLPNKNNTNNNNNALRHQLLFLSGFGLVIMYCREAILKKKKKVLSGGNCLGHNSANWATCSSFGV